jgi:AraC family transcriptional regulator
MRSGRIQSDDPPARQNIRSTIPQDRTKPSLAYSDAHNPFWSLPEVCIENARSWGSISADVVSRTAGKMVWLSDRHRIVYALTDVLGTIRSDNGPAQSGQLLRDNFSFRPSGITLESSIGASVRFIQVVQHRDTYDNIVSEMVRGGAVHLEPLTGLHDPLVSQMVLTDANQIDHGFMDTMDNILADALSTALAVRILRHDVDRSAIELAPSSGLSRERLQRVRDYIEAHLDNRLTLTDLAGVACLSPYHFSRSFKQAVGVGPQHYVMQRRLERARALMRRTNQPLARIAQESGFSDQSHLTSVFRRETGVTPGQFRAALTQT